MLSIRYLATPLSCTVYRFYPTEISFLPVKIVQFASGRVRFTFSFPLHNKQLDRLHEPQMESVLR